MKSIGILAIVLLGSFQINKNVTCNVLISSLEVDNSYKNADSIKVAFNLDTGSVGLGSIQCALGNIDKENCTTKVFNFSYAYNYSDNQGHKKMVGFDDAEINISGNTYSFITKNVFGGKVNYFWVQVTDGRCNYSKTVYYKNSESLKRKYCKQDSTVFPH